MQINLRNDKEEKKNNFDDIRSLDLNHKKTKKNLPKTKFSF